MSSIISCFDDRLRDGFYDAITEQMKAMGPALLADADYGQHFFAETDHLNGTQFVSSQKKIFHTVIFGEIAPAKDGTMLSAKGTHYFGSAENPNFITDGTRIKDLLVLRPPTMAPTELLGIYNDQVGTLNDVRVEDIEKEKSCSITYYIKEWIRTPFEGGLANYIAITVSPKYVIDESLDSVSVDARIGKRRADGLTKNLSTAILSFGRNERQDGPSGNNINLVEERVVGARYEPSLLPDYGGDLFRHTKSKLVQLDIRDEDNNLIAPWEMYEALRPGTLVLVMVTLHCYIMVIDEIKRRKIYQINAEKIKVLAKSDLDVEERSVPQVGNSSSLANDTTSQSLLLASTAFDTLVPHKKTKTVKPEEHQDELVILDNAPVLPKGKSGGPKAGERSHRTRSVIKNSNDSAHGGDQSNAA